jgi:hypothetical protein
MEKLRRNLCNAPTKAELVYERVRASYKVWKAGFIQTPSGELTVA